jgi:hypothetical protein
MLVFLMLDFFEMLRSSSEALVMQNKSKEIISSKWKWKNSKLHSGLLQPWSAARISAGPRRGWRNPEEFFT